MDILTMNKLWIEHSRDEAVSSRENLKYNGIAFTRIKYLDIMGLFETCWMVYGCESHYRYGYPDNE
ncbi:hypothetical protein LCGC14_2515480 [marine sediment metagenome]|uniref:Uncharacterized protein n=1 Tax=marine sediment metagenome TaxID=412755 RepID=A0A0F9D9G9_9ZZZZ